VTVSLDGGNTWLVLVGEKGLRKFINEIRRDKDKGRQLHFRGQEVKRIQSVVFGLTSQKETATTAIDNIESSLENSRQTVSSLEQELGELKELRTELMSRQTDTSRQLEIFRQQLQEEELLLQSCEAFTSQPTSFIEMLIQKVAQFFRPLVLAYGGN
jgi:chromosome segregation ATPase